jgi:hypothetical protein
MSSVCALVFTLAWLAQAIAPSDVAGDGANVPFR